MTNSTEIHGDQHTTVIFGLTGPWVVLMVSVVLVGVVAVIYLISAQNRESDNPFTANTQSVENLALRAADTTNAVTKSTSVGPANPVVHLSEPVKDVQPSIFILEFTDLSEPVALHVNLTPTLLENVDVPPPPRSTVVQAVLVDIDGLVDTESAASLTFTLSESQIGSSEPSSVAMWHFDESWKQLETNYLGMNEVAHSFEAETPGFSLFVITKDTGEVPNPTSAPAPTATTLASPTPAVTQQSTSTPQPQPTDTSVPTVDATLSPVPTATPTSMPMSTSTAVPVTPTSVSVSSPTPISITPIPTRLPTPPTPPPTPQPIKISLIEGTIPVANSGEYFQLKNFRIENIAELKDGISASIKWGDSVEWTGIPILQDSGMIVAGHIYNSGGTFYGDLKIVSDYGDLVIHSFAVFVNGAVIATPLPLATPTPIVEQSGTSTIEPTATATVVAPPIPTPTDTPTPTVEPTLVPTPPPGATATPTAVVTLTPTPLPAATPIPTVTSTPLPTATPTPTPTPIPDQIVFVSGRDGNDEIYVMDSDGTNQQNISNNLLGDYQPSWSPDRTKLVFTSNRDGNEEIYVMDADGSNQTRLTNNSYVDDYATWIDNNVIAFRSERHVEGSRYLYYMNADGTNVQMLTSYDDNEPDWTPNAGTRLIFVSYRDGNAEIYRIEKNRCCQNRLTNYAGADTHPAWSPNAQSIAFTRDDEIFVMNPNGSNPVNLSNNLSLDFHPAWSPDGSKIVFTSHRDGDYGIFVMNTDGSGQTRLTDASHPNWQPDW